jgi:hypothetical protein
MIREAHSGSPCPDCSPSLRRARPVDVPRGMQYKVGDAFFSGKSLNLQERGHLRCASHEPGANSDDRWLRSGGRRRTNARFGGLCTGGRRTGGCHRKPRYPHPAVRHRHRRPTLVGQERLPSIRTDGRHDHRLLRWVCAATGCRRRYHNLRSGFWRIFSARCLSSADQPVLRSGRDLAALNRETAYPGPTLFVGPALACGPRATC